MPENKDSDQWRPSSFFWAVAACCAVGAAAYLHGVATGKREGLAMAPEYVAERLTIDRLEAQAALARAEASSAPPADRYEMCDRIMDMAADMILGEEIEVQRQMDEHAREAEEEIDYR